MYDEKPTSRADFAHSLTPRAEYMEKTFDSQAQAAAALGIAIGEIQEAKRDGCSAFRSGRVYREPLLEWINARAEKRTGQVQPGSIAPVIKTIIGLIESFYAGVIDRDKFFELGTLLIESIENPKFRQLWIEQNFFWLVENFNDLSEARAAHPKIVRWLETCNLPKGLKKNRRPSR